jgi:hypothetical protein
MESLADDYIKLFKEQTPISCLIVWAIGLVLAKAVLLSKNLEI